MHNDKAFAFFDVDDTLVTCKTMFSFQDFWFKTRFPLSGRLRAALFGSQVKRLRRSGSREVLNRFYYSTFAGRRPEDVVETARQWYREERRRAPTFYVDAALAALEWHKSQGREPVLVSGSMVDIIAPISEELGTQITLATRLTVSTAGTPG